MSFTSCMYITKQAAILYYVISQQHIRTALSIRTSMLYEHPLDNAALMHPYGTH